MDTTPHLSLYRCHATVDVSSSDQTIEITARITDDLSGITDSQNSSGYAQLELRSPSGEQNLWVNFSENNRIDGDANDGLYKAELTIPAFAEAGEWSVGSIEVQDSVGNDINVWDDSSFGDENYIPENLRLTFVSANTW